MSLNLSIPDTAVQGKPKITVIGVGGAGGNAVNNMIRSNLEEVDFIVANTDAQALEGSLCERRIQLGVNITQGLGAGARPDIGRAAAEEMMGEIETTLHGSNMVFVAAGMGGGTGSGAAPVIARVAREQGILTVGVVTKPFLFEGSNRMQIAEAALKDLQQYVDTLIVIPNQNLFRIANEHTTFADAFKMADDVLYNGVRGVTDLILVPGVVNLDFADIRTVMSEMGKAMMGTGEADGDGRAIAAAQAAISNPLLDDVSMRGAKAVLINFTGGMDLGLMELDEAANRVRDEVDGDARILWGTAFDPEMEGRVRVSVIATGVETVAARADQPLQAAQMVPQQAPIANRAPAPAAAPAQAPRPAPQPAPAEARAERRSQTATQLAEALSADRQARPAQPAMRAQATAPRPAPQEPREVDGAFIAPPPVRADQPAAPQDLAPQPQVPQAPAAQMPPQAPAAPQPAAEAAPQAPAQPAAARAPSLFERVTGAARPREDQAPAAPRQVHPAPEAPRQASLSVDPQDRAPSSNPEQDLLEIPAFLRR